MNTMTKRPAEQGRPERRRNQSETPYGRDRKGALRRSELSRLFADLDQAMYSMYLEAEINVTPSGYALTAHPAAWLTDEIDEEWFRYLLEHCLGMVQGIVAEMAVRFRLPDEWPTQFFRLFPKEYLEECDGDFPYGLRMSGSAIRVSPAGPTSVLHNQLDYSRAEPLATTLGQVARAAGFKSLASIRANYEASWPSKRLLPDEIWEEVALALSDVGIC
jgi:hypothetical protein